MTNTIILRDRSLVLPGRPLLMGILNVTPDSFSDGGSHQSVAAAVDHAQKMVDAGAEIIDIGGESTRPGSQTVPIEQEIERVAPTVAALKQHLPQVVISVDTRKSQVAAAALEAGAEIVNDVSGLTYDPALAAITAAHQATLALMHMRGTPSTMQQPENLVYGDMIMEITEFLRRASGLALAAGIKKEQIIWDPGLGFSKDLQQNLTLLRRITEFHAEGYPLLVGPSRKSFIGALLHRPEPTGRDWGTAGVACHLASAGVQIIRVHNVAAIADALTVFSACRQGE